MLPLLVALATALHLHLVVGAWLRDSTQNGFVRVPRARKGAASSAKAANTTSSLQPNGDAVFSVSADTVSKATTCPNGVGQQAGGVVLLVHGTGSNGEESWGGGPYVKILQNGFDPCFVDLPGRALDDAQRSAEFVAQGILTLAPQSKTGKVNVVGHSQGAGMNIQWALQFFPSTQPLVQNYIALSGDFKGTTLSKGICAVACAPSIQQQTAGSDYLGVQADTALVPTTSIFTVQDEVIQPETGPNPTSDLDGASVIAVQDDKFCGSGHDASHVEMTADPGAFALAKLTLENGGPVDVSQVDKAACDTYLDDPDLFDQQAALVQKGTAADGAAILAGPTQRNEPPLQASQLGPPYVCELGLAQQCGDAFPPS